MHIMASEAHANRSTRRFYRAEFETQVMQECCQGGDSVAGVALSHGINANIPLRTCPTIETSPFMPFLGMHIFGQVCNENCITHRLTKPYYPWTNGQAERMNRTVKEGTIKAFHYPDLKSLKAHVLAFVCAFNFAKHLKALRWKTPYQTIVYAWQKNPAIFKTDPRSPHPGAIYIYLVQTSASMTKKPKVIAYDAAGVCLTSDLFVSYMVD